MNKRDLLSISVIVPTRLAERYIPQLIESLKNQTIPPIEIIIIDTASTDRTVNLASKMGCRTIVIGKNEFNHGATRNRAAAEAVGDILVFMTQDALPTDSYFLEELTQPIRMGGAQAVCARHIPYPDATPLETFSRLFNYHDRPHTRTLKDIKRLSIKAFFFSNVAAAVDRNVFFAIGCFPESVIMNEDMVLCSKLLKSNFTVAYQATAKVFHSHNYSLRQTFNRYFDIGVFMSRFSDQFEDVRAEGEGKKYVKEQIQYLYLNKHYVWLPRCLLEAFIKIVAYKLGKQEQWLPLSLKRHLSMHQFYWSKDASLGGKK